MSPALGRGGGSQARMMMTHRARVLRGDDTPTDDWGGPEPDDTPTEQYAALACYAWSPTDAREVLDEDAAGVFGAVRIAMPADCGVTERDTISSIVDRLERTVFAGPLSITAVTPMSGHLAVMARVQRGGR